MSPKSASGLSAWSGAITGVTVNGPANLADGSANSYVAFDALSLEVKTAGEKSAGPTESRLPGSKSSRNNRSKYDPRLASEIAICQPRFPVRPGGGNP